MPEFKKEVVVRISPEELGRAFTQMRSSEQAAFWDGVVKESKTFRVITSAANQWNHMREFMYPEAKQLLVEMAACVSEKPCES